MYLKALKLHGFKSFADSTVLSFDPGVTSIVGPNGCGKSNIADAIRWVLGEQSAKALRGGKMQDVIFEGTDTRKPLALCEVSLLLTECERQLGTDFHEVEITRRVSRDGQSDYLLNGQFVRLKDIHKLFMDTGVGRTSYSIMAQGQIDQILSSKPEERRTVFEEAAGITKYKAQRREALSKLALTDQNLARIVDVISEVGRQIGSLRRQAAKAIRYKRVSFRLRHLSLALSNWQYRQLSAILADLEGRVAVQRSDAEIRRTSLEERQQALEQRKSARSELNQRGQDAQQAVFDLRSQKEQAENQAGLALVRRTGLLERIEGGRQDLAELEMQLKELATQVDTGAQDKQMQLSLLGSSDAVFQDRNRELAVVEGELTRDGRQLDEDKFRLLQLESTVARLRTDSSSLEVDARTSQLRHDQVAAEIEEVRQIVAGAAATLGQVRLRVEAARADQSRAHNEAQAAQQALQESTQRFREGQRKLQEIDRSLAQKAARLKLLQQMQEKWEGFGEGAKALLSGRLDGLLEGRKLVPVTRGLEVKVEYAKALEAILGSSVEAIGVADLGTAQRIIAHLEQGKIGSVHMQVAEVGSRKAATDTLPAGLRPATEAVDGLDESHPVASLLSSCYIADDLNAFLDHWKTNPGFSFLMVATPKGDLVDRRGVVFGGYHKRPDNTIVQREIDLRETARQVAREQQAHAEQRSLIDQLNASLAQAEAALEQKRKDVLVATQQAAGIHSEEKSAQRSHDEAQIRFTRMENELANLKLAHDEAQTRLAKAQAGLAEADGAVAAQREKIAAMEKRLAEIRGDRDLKKEALAQARLELAERRQKVEVLDRGLTEMERRRVQLADLYEQREIELETWSEQVKQLESESAAQKLRAEEIAQTLAVAHESLEKIRTELVAVEQDISGLETGLAAIRTEAETAQGELSQNEVKVAETRARAQFLTEEVQREFQVEVATQDWQQLLWHADDEPEGLKALDLDEEDEPSGSSVAVPATGEIEAKSATKRRRREKAPKGDPTEQDLIALAQTSWDEVRIEVEALRTRLQGMGAVNLVAIEEYSELKQRFEFLKAQSDDLTNAKAQLLKAIDDINQTSLRQFEVTFEQIKKNFIYTFHTLFGGGHAELDLVVTEDPLESGIDIIAQPPGTKLRNITLLSGGQKTLTAVALLFALYLVKPSPFCLLDELDAPLDESNIHRFTNLLKQFTKDSQFLIITHNKSTIATADAIYGVTMQERGVSKILSMRFNQERGEAEAVSSPTIADAVRNAHLSPIPAGA
ncbi:MAG: chromosome segregation protein SMC [Opitutaceae bacterium]|nr:chromosome segregation protein SMC [Opitutaceae bacterium]